LAACHTLPQQGRVSAIRVTRESIPDPAGLADAWRALEARAEFSFFQSWTWVGCEVAARFPDAVLLRAERDGDTVGLALCNRARGTLWLGESGDPAWDAAYVEHNGPLLARDAQNALPALLRAGLGRFGRLRLSGIPAGSLAAARQAGAVRILRAQPAPCLDLTVLGEGEDGFLQNLSANTRYQLRRSDRAYAAAGPIRARRAETLAEANDFLDALARLHQQTWTAREKPGAFANRHFVRFHQTLLARALPRGEAELLHVAAGDRTIGYLYNFRHAGRVLAYQSGFDYATRSPHEKPGLTCHHAAIRAAQATGATAYDFLAGPDRYKTSLANTAPTLLWLDLAARWSPRGLAFMALGRGRQGQGSALDPQRG
jgi:CelD/BcsL family acetyltransferase involved in cellulose biosynthesis